MKSTITKTLTKSWWSSDIRVEKYMPNVTKAIKLFIKHPSIEFTAIYNSAYEAVYQAITDSEELMTKDKRSGWLADLDVGDGVIVVGIHNTESYAFISVVDKIAADGSITVRDINILDLEFDSSGEIHTKDETEFRYLRQLTNESRKQLRRMQAKTGLVKSIRIANLDKLTEQQLIQIKEIINGGHPTSTKV